MFPTFTVTSDQKQNIVKEAHVDHLFIQTVTDEYFLMLII